MVTYTWASTRPNSCDVRHSRYEDDGSFGTPFPLGDEVREEADLVRRGAQVASHRRMEGERKMAKDGR